MSFNLLPTAAIILVIDGISKSKLPNILAKLNPPSSVFPAPNIFLKKLTTLVTTPSGPNRKSLNLNGFSGSPHLKISFIVFIAKFIGYITRSSKASPPFKRFSKLKSPPKIALIVVNISPKVSSRNIKNEKSPNTDVTESHKPVNNPITEFLTLVKVSLIVVVMLSQVLVIQKTTSLYISTKNFLIEPKTESVSPPPNTFDITLNTNVNRLSIVSLIYVPIELKNVLIPSHHSPSPKRANDSLRPENRVLIFSHCFIIESQKKRAIGLI